MTKRDIQKRVLSGGKTISLKDFTWNRSTKTFESGVACLVLDFTNCNNINFVVTANCVINAGSGCTFNAGNGCTFDVLHGCSFKAGYVCTFNTGAQCKFTTDSQCTFTTGPSCSFDTGNTSVFTTQAKCDFYTGNACMFRTFDHCDFRTGDLCVFDIEERCKLQVGRGCTVSANFGSVIQAGAQSVIVNRNVFETIQVRKPGSVVELAPSCVPGHLLNGTYSETGRTSIIADNTLSELVSTRRLKSGVSIHKVINYGSGKVTYLVQSDGIYAHGDTLKEARDSIKYKIGDRDTSMYGDYTLDTVLNEEDAIKLYRTITGACEAGTRSFVEALDNKPKQLKVADLITLTKGSYGNKDLAAFFTEGGE